MTGLGVSTKSMTRYAQFDGIGLSLNREMLNDAWSEHDKFLFSVFWSHIGKIESHLGFDQNF